MARASFLVLLTIGLAGSQCTTPACSTIAVFGVTATVVNAVTGSPITYATLTLTEGTYSEAMEFIGPDHYVGAAERAGTYTLTASAPGFHDQTTHSIVVTADECHVKGIQVNVQLQPVPQ